MSKKNKLPIKIESPYTCPNCGEKNYFYISKKGKKKGILVGEYFHESFFDPHHGNCYDCYTCDHHWNVRDEESKHRLLKFLK